MEIATVNKHLQQNEIEAISKVRADLKPFIENKNSPKAHQIDGRELMKHIRDRVQVSLEHSGAVDKNEQAGAITSVSMEVYQWLITSKYKHITLSEITDAFRRGGSGEYETEKNRIFGYGADRFMKFIRGYMESSERESAMKDWLKQIDAPGVTEKPISDMFKVNMEIAVKCFETFKAEPKAMKGTVYATETGSFHLPTIFNFLVDNFEIPFSAETKAEVLKQAKTDYWEFIKSGLSRQEKKDGKLQILIQSVQLDTNRTYEYYCDAEGLRVLFTKLIDRQKTINDLKRKV